MQVGGFAPVQSGMTVEQWDDECRKLGNHFDRIWDDAHQITHIQRNLIHNHNLYTGAGISRDGSAEGRDFGAGRPLSLCNIFDGSQCRLFLHRKGRDSTNREQTGEGLRHPNTLVAHGDYKRPFPWIKINDTEIWGDDCTRLDQAKGLHGAGGSLQNLGKDEVNVEYNGIVIDKGVFDSVSNQFSRPWAGSLDVTTGKDIRDGNLIVNLAEKAAYQILVKTSQQQVARVKTVKDLHTLAFEDSKAYYSPGIDANSVEINVSAVSDVLDTTHAPDHPDAYVPHHPDAVQGAVDLSSLINHPNIPGHAPEELKNI